MKIILLSLIISLANMAALSLTRNIAWSPKDRPRMELSKAMQIAHERLNAQEGLPAGDDKFYCIRANLAVTTSKDGDWTFIFGSKEGVQRWVSVDFEGLVDIRPEPPEY